ncbi:hypothetical protein PCANC_05341 [Puccinia coronata f. sp. avenae]|uniref:Uncharacterized protein n=1 Tax=Puccinia coronata f. sp. avenae TaxID=200324 RepID=A0A2N5VXD1_9BASI|nr:hypothetical protein PCASD_25669 [Puccinia coronata f. sp. avenae]PLW43778.1 hypothetical protein PCASD_09378 [Puccinia coronata f. sp. avenae]PLW54654.1 hypothetical protein PCANC_05341 [Puccinia coronata f. sp. avenae]
MIVVLQDEARPVPAPSTGTPTGDEAEAPLDLLILGAGWTAGFLISCVEERKEPFRYRTTTTSGGGRWGSLKFKFDPTKQGDPESNQFESLPDTRAILVSFPITHPGGSAFLLDSYLRTRHAHFFHSVPFLDVLQLGSSGIFDGGPTLRAEADSKELQQKQMGWIDRHSPYDQENPRASSEDELLGMNGRVGREGSHLRLRTTVLNLSGLWGGARSIRNYVGKVAPTKEALRAKTSVHMIHGLDVARAVLAVLAQFQAAAGQRWILTDMRVYDWWDLAAAWGQAGLANPEPHAPVGPQALWVSQLLDELHVQALPRSPSELGRAIDSREFWRTFNLSPIRARLEHFA